MITNVILMSAQQNEIVRVVGWNVYSWLLEKTGLGGGAVLNTYEVDNYCRQKKCFFLFGM